MEALVRGSEKITLSPEILGEWMRKKRQSHQEAFGMSGDPGRVAEGGYQRKRPILNSSPHVDLMLRENCGMPFMSLLSFVRLNRGFEVVLF